MALNRKIVFMALLFSDFCFCFLIFKFHNFKWSTPTFSAEQQNFTDELNLNCKILAKDFFFLKFSSLY
jgi:hypothetical protein